MNKAEFKQRILECGERSFYADDTVNNVFRRNPIYMMSWGWDKLIYLQSEDYPEEQVGFMFRVNGLLFKGEVMVTLSWNDTFTVRFFRRDVAKDGTVSAVEVTEMQENEVYVDRLLMTIDGLVEKAVVY